MALTTTEARLSLAALERIPAASRPAVRPCELRPGIVHLGLGAFHRAHQAVYTEEAIAATGDHRWGILGVAPRSTEVYHHLSTQDGLFSVVTLAPGSTEVRVIGALAGVRHAASDPMAVVALLADPDIRIVTLTVTEKAYALDPATGRLTRDADVMADLNNGEPPQTIPGLLVRGLLARARADAGPLALVSCDNLPSNGRRLHSLVAQALELADPRGAAADWVSRHVTFPGTTVDRIVPATTPETLARARAALGVTDLAAVAAEPYRQWVIEDEFPGGRPAWDRVGVVMTADAGPYERLKLRALNGVHSTLAYLGALAEEPTIADALAIPNMRRVLEAMLADDIAPSFDPPPGVSTLDYGQSVLARFANPAIGHRTLQVAMDGTQKLPQRVLHTLADRRAAGGEPRWMALVVAAWMRFAQGRSDSGLDLPLDDPMAPAIRAALDGTQGTPDAVLDALFGLDTVFPPELSGDPLVRGLVLDWLTALSRHGVRATLAGAFP